MATESTNERAWTERLYGRVQATTTWNECDRRGRVSSFVQTFVRGSRSSRPPHRSPTRRDSIGCALRLLGRVGRLLRAEVRECVVRLLLGQTPRRTLRVVRTRVGLAQVRANDLARDAKQFAQLLRSGDLLFVRHMHMVHERTNECKRMNERISRTNDGHVVVRLDNIRCVVRCDNPPFHPHAVVLTPRILNDKSEARPDDSHHQNSNLRRRKGATCRRLTVSLSQGCREVRRLAGSLSPRARVVLAARCTTA